MGIYKPYTQWEDWKCGMYRHIPSSQIAGYVVKSVSLLSDQVRLLSEMSSVCDEWSNSALTHLLGDMQHHRSWLGQAACCHSHGANEECTRLAWCELSQSEQRDANAVADFVYESFLTKHGSSQLMLAFE